VFNFTNKFYNDLNFIFTLIFVILLCTPIVFWNGAMIPYGITIFGWILSATVIILKTEKIRIFKIQLLVVIWIIFVLFYRLLGISSAIFFNYASIIVFWLSFFIYCFYHFYFPKIYKIRLCQFSIVILLANIVQNFVILILYPNASRGTTQGGANYNYYRSLNIGSTSFVFAALLLFIIFLGLFINEKKKLVKTSYFFILILLIYFQFQCARLIAILLMFISIILFFLHGKKNKLKILGIILAIPTIILFSIYSKSILLYFSQNIKNQYLATRFYDLASIFEGNNLNDSTAIRRLYLYKISLKTFLNNPFFGVGEHWNESYITRIGQHSEIFDTLARYGIFGGVVWVSFYYWYFIKIVKKDIHISVASITFIIFVIYSFFNNIVSHQAQTAVFFFIIPFLYTLELNN